MPIFSRPESHSRDAERPRKAFPRRAWERVFGVVLLLGITLGVVTLIYLFHDLPSPHTLTTNLVKPSIRITDRHGRLLYEVLDADGGRHANLDLANIPTHLQQATIAVEDKNFYTNPGVDIAGIARAFWINLRGGEVIAGGSTITQQVTRNLLFSDDEIAQRTVRRKLRESWLAWRVAQLHDKDEILALYLNQIYYGAIAYGVEAAAQTYFAKPVADLTLAESALIAGLPQAPGTYNPFTNPDAAKVRQEVVLGLMLKAGDITPAEHDLAVRQPLQYATTPYPVTAPHFVLMVNSEIDRLFTPTDLIETGGLTVRTTLDLDWQEDAESVITEQLVRLNNPPDGGVSHNAQNASLVALDPHSGEILAFVGNADYFSADTAGAVNMALSPRQPGSALKPLIYAAAMSPEIGVQGVGGAGVFTAATMLADVRTVFPTKEGTPYVPTNYSKDENGPVLLRRALGSSLNIPAVATLQAVGLDKMFDFVETMGIRTLGDRDQYGLSFALGGGPVRLLDLTNAFGVFANGGFRQTPSFILEVTDVAGNTLYQPEPTEAVRVLDERVAWLMSDMLSDNGARMPAFGANSILNLDRTAAVKTGTTNDFRDNWTVGYTPDLVVGVWVGNASNAPMVDITGVSGAGPIWHFFMRKALAGVPDQPFSQPPGLVRETVCALSGLLPTDDCPYQRREWFIAGTQPLASDTFYRQVTVDTQTNKLATDDTIQAKAVLVLDLPPQFHAWARANELPLLADLTPTLAELTQTDQPEIRIVSPDQGGIYRIDAGMPIESQKLLFAVDTSGIPLRQLTFYLNAVPLATLAEPPYQFWWQLVPGEYVLRVEGVGNAGISQQSPPLTFTVHSGN